jgi:hypothetical protein
MRPNLIGGPSQLWHSEVLDSYAEKSTSFLRCSYRFVNMDARSVMDKLVHRVVEADSGYLSWSTRYHPRSY